MKKYLEKFYIFSIKLIDSIISLLSVILFTNFRSTIKFNHLQKTLRISKDCIIFGNGPSLKNELENKKIDLNNKDIFVVNLFCNYSLFFTIQPRYYVLADNAFFQPKNEDHKKIYNQLIVELNKVTWKMILLIPASKKKNLLISNLHNENIEVIFLNTTPVQGFMHFSHILYKLNLGMPRCQTVVNFAIFSAINLKYSNIFLYGVDHSWTKDLFVNDVNEVCYGDRHVYNTSLTIIKKEKKMDELLLSFSLMFKTHRELRAYSDKIGSMIYNCTKASFIDCYERV